MNNVVPLHPRIPSVLRIIREVAKDSSRLRLAPSVQTAFASGLVNFRQILHVLQTGSLSQGPYPDAYGLICCELEGIAAGRMVRAVISLEGRSPSQRILHILFAEEL